MKKVVIIIAMVVVSIATTSVLYYLDNPFARWSYILLGFPVAYAGIHYRRTGSIMVMYSLFLFNAFVVLREFERHGLGGAFASFFAALAVGFSSLYIGHVMRKEKDDADIIEQTRDVVTKLRHDVDENDLLDVLEDRFREYGKSETVELFLFDEQGQLRPRTRPDDPPLPAKHIFYEIAKQNDYFVSYSTGDDPRLHYQAETPDNVEQMAVFTIYYGGSARGVIALANSTDDRFGSEMLSFLNTIKQSVESVLETLEKKRTTINHQLQEKRIRDTFSSYVSRTVAEEILKDPDKLDMGGRQQKVTVMFSEVMNFDALMAQLKPEDLIAMMNEYFAAAIDTVFSHEGTLDKFIEDNVMAFWGAPLPQPDSEERAVRCAQDLLRRMDRLNSDWEARGMPRFHVCIGVNTGPAVAGNIGSIRRMEYTVIGDTVNTAARIRALSKSKQIPILVSQSTYEQVKDRFAFGESIETTVKGKSDYITVHELLLKEAE